MTVSPQVEKFLQSIVDHADKADMTPEVRQHMIQVLAEQFDTYILSRALDHLSDTDLDSYNTLLTTQPTQDQVQQFLDQHIPNLSDIVRQAMVEFYQRYTDQ